MRAILALMILSACTGGDDGMTGTDGGMTGSGSDAPAWSGGPNGHVYTYSGPLYDIDARDGHVLRQIATHSASNLVASPDTAYFDAFDANGTGRIFELAPDATMTTQISDASPSTIYGVHGNELIGEVNEQKIVRVDVTTGAVMAFPFPSTLSHVFVCENGSLSGTTVYLVCNSQTSSSTGVTMDAGMLTFDLATNTFGPYVAVTTMPDSLTMASNVTNTPSGVIFTLYTGTPPNGATLGTRTVYKITGTTVSAPVAISGNSNDLDEQGGVGNTVFIAFMNDDTVVPFDAGSMTAGAPIAVDHPHHVRIGGGQVWLTSEHHDGRLVKLDPASRAVVYKSFPPVVSSDIRWLAYGGE